MVISLSPSKTKSLITSSVAVVLFACCYSLTSQTANDQTLGAAGYKAVLKIRLGKKRKKMHGVKNSRKCVGI